MNARQASLIARMRLQQAAGPGLLLACCCFAPHPVCAAAEGAPPAEVLALRGEAQAYEHGEGVVRNPGKAVELYCIAARQGDDESQFNLGWMHANGRGIPRDDALAAYFFGLAAQRGHSQAREMLGRVGNSPAEPPACMRDMPTEPGAATEATPAENISPLKRKLLDLVHKLAPEYGIYPRLALAVMHAESDFDPVAVSPKNAQGLMQLIPETAARFNVRKPFDPEQNIRGGLAYLRWLLAYFKGNVALVAAAYNAGEGTVNRFKGIPPYPETRGYVTRIMKEYAREEHPYDGGITEPSPDLPRMRPRRMM